VPAASIHGKQRPAAGLLNVVAMGGDSQNVDGGVAFQFSSQMTNLFLQYFTDN
jgi:hypothetical protein